MADRLYQMPIGDFLRRRPEAMTCQACGSPLPTGAIFCPACGVRADDPQAEPLHIVDRTTGLFNERFVRPVLEDELARAHRYQRNLGVLLIEAPESASVDETLKAMAAALAGTVRDVDTPGVLSRNPPQLLAILPDTDVAGTAHAATRVLASVNEALKGAGGRAAVGLVCVRPGQRVRAGAVIESASRSLRSGRPEMMGKPA
jgi:PleD family two-component response regulator